MVGFGVGIAKNKLRKEHALKHVLKLTADLEAANVFACLPASVVDTGHKSLPDYARVIETILKTVPEELLPLAKMKWVERKKSKEIAKLLGEDYQKIRNRLKYIAVTYIYPAAEELLRANILETATAALQALLDQKQS